MSLNKCILSTNITKENSKALRERTTEFVQQGEDPAQAPLLAAQELLKEAESQHQSVVSQLPQELEQAKSEKPTKKKLGGILFPKTGIGTGKTRISFTDNADLSTFIHETGHFIFEMYRDIASQPDASPKAVADMEALYKWLEVKSSSDIEVKHHEQIARGFEAYLREGKPPVPELQGMFSRMKGWLLSLYKNIADLDVKLTDDVRQVFDRMLASEEAVQAAEDQLFMPAFDANSDIQTEAEYQAYTESIKKAHDLAQTDLEKKAITEFERGKKQAWRDELRLITFEMQQKLGELPSYRAKHYLMRGKLPDGSPLPDGMKPVKLSRNALNEMYPDKQMIKRLPVGDNSVIAKEGGAHPDDIAMLFGYESGDAMIRAIVDAKSISVVAKAEAKAMMKAKHGDMMGNADQLTKEALDSVHRDERANVMLVELKALEKKAGLKPTPRQVLKQTATRLIGEKDVGKIREYDYIREEQKYGRVAYKAVADGDYVAARNAKMKQLLNYYMFMEARRAVKEIGVITRFANKLTKQGSRKNLAVDYLEQLDSILEAYDFKKSVSLKEIERRKSLQAWIAEREEAGEEVVVPADIIERSRKRSYKDISMNELRGVNDSLQNIVHLARLKQKLLINKEMRDLDELAGELKDIAKEHNKWRDDPPDLGGEQWSELSNWGTDFAAELKKIEFVMHQLDGNKHNGKWWNAVFRPFADAENEEMKMQEDAVKALKEIHDVYTKKERSTWHSKKLRTADIIGRDLTKAQIFAIARNMGNAGNLKALLEGSHRYMGRSSENQNWTQEQVQEVVNRHLTEKDFDYVQATLDYVGTYWPQIAALQKELTGVVPKHVDATPIQTPFGEIPGGYFPLSYDPALSDKSYRREQKKMVDSLYGANYVSKSTDHGHTEERVGSGGQAVMLSMDVLGDHVTNVIHDLTHRKALMQADKILRHPKVAGAIKSTAGESVYKMMNPWLVNIANSTRPPLTSGEKFIGMMRKNATIVNMGWKLTTGIVQPLGYLQSVEFLGEKYAAVGLGKFYKNPSRMKDVVFEKSVMMRNRSKTFDRDVKNAIDNLVREGKFNQLQQTWFWHIGFMDLGVSMPTWVGGYEKAIAENMSETDAVAFADSMVRMSQSSGSTKDLAHIQTGHPMKQTFTMFYSYFSVLHNIMIRRGKMTVAEGARSLPRAMMSFMYLVALPAVLSEMITGRWDFDDDEEEQINKALKLTMLYPVQTVPYARDMINGIIGDYRYSMNPVADALGTVARGGAVALDSVAEGDIERYGAKTMTMATGYIFGLPSRQLWLTGEGLYDILAEGEDLDLVDLLLTKKRD